MKEILKRSFCVMFTCMLLIPMAVQAEENQEATLQNATAQYAIKDPKIDGKIDEVWDTTPFYYAKHRENTGEAGEQARKNPIEGSYAKILWDEDYYYLLGVVYDTTLSEAGFTDWNSVDYWISEKNTQEYGWDADEGDYCYCITDDGTPVPQHGDKTVIDNAEKSVQNHGDYYVVEIKIPWQSDVVVENGHEIGFTVSFNDDMDGDGERDAYTYWAAGNNGEYWNNTNALASVELIGQPEMVSDEPAVNPYIIIGVIAGPIVVIGICVVCIVLGKKRRK